MMKEDYTFPDNADFTADIRWRLDEAIERHLDYYDHRSKTDELNDICNPTSIEEAFQQNQFELFELFKVKNRNYGSSNIAGGDDVDLSNPVDKRDALLGLYFRMRDKLNRFRQIIETQTNGTADESLSDTLGDLSNYGIIAKMVNENQWK